MWSNQPQEQPSKPQSWEDQQKINQAKHLQKKQNGDGGSHAYVNDTYHNIKYKSQMYFFKIKYTE